MKGVFLSCSDSGQEQYKYGTATYMTIWVTVDAFYTSAYVRIRQNTSAYVSIRQHTSAYVSIGSIRQPRECLTMPSCEASWAAVFSIRLLMKSATTFHLSAHTSAYVSIRQHEYVNIRQHTSAYVSIRHHTSAYVSIRRTTLDEISTTFHLSARHDR